MEIDVLLKHKGIGRATIQRLKDAGIYTVEQLATMTTEDLAELGIGGTRAMLLLRLAREQLGFGLITAKELRDQKKQLRKLTTGSRNLDSILGGGVEPLMITEFFGEYGSGKTQLSHQLAVNTFLPPEMGGLNHDGEASVVYVDTEGTFSTSRIMEMASRYRGVLDPDVVVDRIYVARAINSEHQMSIVEDLFSFVPRHNVRLVIVDSITRHFRVEYPGRERLAIRQQKLGRHINQLATLATMFRIPVVVTNQVHARPDVYYGDPTQAVGGHVLYHAMGVRVQLRKGKGRQRIARVIDAPHLPDAEAVFVITERGIEDPE